MPEPSGHVAEVFASFQGEGLLAGAPQVFVRLAGCDRACAFCDTPQARARTGEKTEIRLAAGRRWRRPNPWRPSDLVEVLEAFGPLPVWLTGGEPLLQAEFVEALLVRIGESRPAGLESHGQRPGPLHRLAPHLRWIAADAKLPSATGEPLDWEAFEAFLRAGRSPGLFVKAVVTAATAAGEVRDLFGRVGGVDPAIPVFLQPVTPRTGIEAPGFPELLSLAREGLASLRDVRVLPQVHRLAGWE